MVEQACDLDNVFQALANQHRRDILRRASVQEQTAGKLAQTYGLTIAAVVKQFAVLERAGLLLTEKRGKERFARLAETGFQDAAQWLSFYEKYWNSQLDSMTRQLEAPGE